VEAWIENPDQNPAMALKLKKRIAFVFGRLVDAGHLAGDDYFAKLNAVDDLWEAKIDVGNRAVRIFGDVAPGRRIFLTKVHDGKKRRSLPTKDYKMYERMVKEHVASVTGGKGVARS